MSPANIETTVNPGTVRWLSSDEELAWRAMAQLIHNLRWALECQLQRDAGLSFVEYHALARLSEVPNHTLRMKELAALTNSSLSRLSHLVKRLESWGLVRREPDPTDGRMTHAILTDVGYAKLVACAPDHVAMVRELFVDEFGRQELAHVRDVCERILTRIENSGLKQELA
jgi:DNA-binding MarR family transcriptional regulator